MATLTCMCMSVWGTMYRNTPNFIFTAILLFFIDPLYFEIGHTIYKMKL